MTSVDRNEERVLILARTEQDVTSIRDMLLNGNIPSDVCASADEFLSKLRDGIGIGLLTDDALNLEGMESLFQAVQDQPAWSDIPFLLLTNAGEDPEVPRATNATVLERPIRRTIFLSAVRSALRARRKQYEVRDYLAERGRAEQDLRQTQKLESIGVLAGGVAHDFNNLLVGILGNASLAVEVIPRDSEAQPMLQDVILAGHKAADLTRQLLAYSGKGKFDIGPLDLSSLVREITILIQPSIPRSVRLRFDLDRDLPAIEGDSSQLQQLIMNLVINGAEAIGEAGSGSVEIKTSVCDVGPDEEHHAIPPTEIAPGRYVCLEVRDSGSGMDRQTLSKIFDPFFTTKLAGRGLGLAAALGIVRGHHGGIEADSAPGKGAAFRVYLPTLEGRQIQPLGAAPREDLAGAGLILVVDDEEMVRNVARASLARYGYGVLSATDGREGVELFRENASRILLVILDMTMPVMGGDEAMAELRKIQPGVKIILSSGYSEIDALRRFSGRGLAGFIQKPYTSSELAQKVKAALGNKAESAQP